MFKEDTNPNWFEPGQNAISALETFVTCLISPPSSLSQRDRSYTIDTDASSYRLGAILLQLQDLEDEIAWRPVA